jgi:hypothetical protein
VTWSYATAALLIATAFTTQPAPASVINFVSGNSTAQITTSTGLTRWTLDGVNYLNNQSFWYRTGSSGREQPLAALPNTFTVGTTDPTAGPDIATLTYTGTGFKVVLIYTLMGGQDVGENAEMGVMVGVINTSGASLGMHLFEYSDFNLGNQGPGQIAYVGGFGDIKQTDQHSLFERTTTSVAPQRYEVGTATGLMAKFTDTSITTLSDSPHVGIWTNPADTAWAFQWDFTMAKGASFLFSQDTAIDPVPEPASLALLASSALLVGVNVLRRRRARAA